MFMDITLYINNSEPNKIHKSLSGGHTLSCVLKQPTSVLNPVIIITDTIDVIDYNYAYIESFSRYYYITDIKSVKNTLWEISLQSDPLMSFAGEISHCGAIIEKSSEIDDKASPYIKTEANVVLSKRKTDIVPFPSGFDDDGKFILITAGGFAT